MNNKKLGTEFENEMCKLLSEKGWWVHFIEPKPNGAQPFDIIAVKYGRAIAIDCKTSSTKRFDIKRLEDNQICAFEKWIACGNEMPIVAIKYNGEVYTVQYEYLKHKKVVDLEELKWAKWSVLPV